jgi:alpha-tubulin suppressor-like RCC1 family protein
LLERSSEQTILDSTTGLPLAGIVSVQDGQYHGCAAVSDGSAQCWQVDSGNGNTSGQLGNGTTMANAVLYRATPVLMAANTPLTDVSSVAHGVSNAGCAVTTAGGLYCWGDLTWLVNKGTALLSGYAQAITTDGATPLANVQQVALGYTNACALLKGDSAHEVWCWGNNAAGELGQGDAMPRQYPIKVLGLTDPTKLVIEPTVDFGQRATVCALDGGSVRCWGDNYGGAAGVNSATNPIPGPTLVVNQSGAALDNVQDMELGNSVFAVLRGDALWDWGYGDTGYAANYGIPNVVAIGYAGGNGGGGPRYVTSDGIYHSAMTNVTVNCGAL